MAFRSAGLTASLALAANAFMIPSTVSMPDVGLDGLDPVIAAHDTSARTAKVPCPGCTFEGSSDVDNSMVLTWSLANDASVLLLNGREFYNGKLESWTHKFPTVQVPSSVSIDDVLTRLGEVATPARDMSYRVFERITHAADGTDAQLIDVDFSVTSLGEERVYGADSLTLRILKDEQGRLALADMVQVPSDNTTPAHEIDEEVSKPSNDAEPEPETEQEQEQSFSILPVGRPAPPTIPMGQKMECAGQSEALCRMRAVIAHQMDVMRSALHATGNRLVFSFTGKMPHHDQGAQRRPCKGKHQAGPPGMMLKGGMPKLWRLGHPAADMEHPHPHGMHPHGARKGGCGMRRFLVALRRIFFGFVLPVFLGVAAGLSASLVGMVVGTGLAMFWIRCVRGGRRGNASVQLEAARSEVAVDGEEKTGLMEEQREEELPAYEDAPAYEVEGETEGKADQH